MKKNFSENDKFQEVKPWGQTKAPTFRNSKNANYQAPVEEKHERKANYDDQDRWDVEEQKEHKGPKPQLLKPTIEVDTKILKKESQGDGFQINEEEYEVKGTMPTKERSL